MVHQLVTTFKKSSFKKSSAIAIGILLTSKVKCLSTEYVFSAPPEVGQESLEIPSSDKEYPLYECITDSEREETETETALDHNCSCLDCQDLEQESEQQSELDEQNTPENKYYKQ